MKIIENNNNIKDLIEFTRDHEFDGIPKKRLPAPHRLDWLDLATERDLGKIVYIPPPLPEEPSSSKKWMAIVLAVAAIVLGILFCYPVILGSIPCLVYAAKQNNRVSDREHALREAAEFAEETRDLLKKKLSS